MKKLIMILVVAGCVVPARAQLFSDEALGGALIGGVIGGVVGHNSGRRMGEGAAIGAGAGLLLGAISHNARQRREAQYAPAGHAPQGYYASQRPNYAVAGAVVGGVAGGVIGHNSGRKTGEGIAIGAGAGLLIGAVAEHNARQREAEAAERAALINQAAAAEALQHAEAGGVRRLVTEQTTVVQTQYVASSPSMAPANALFGR